MQNDILKFKKSLNRTGLLWKAPTGGLRATAGLVLCFFATGLCASQQADGPWLRYESEGGISPYEKVIITIADDGKTAVEVKRRNTDSYTYTTTLSAEEIANLQTLIRAVDYFGQPAKDTALTMDSETTLLSIRVNGAAKELIFRYRPALEPLVWHLQRLLTQAEAIQDLTQDGNAYRLLNATSGHLTGTRVLQFRMLVSPLKTFIAASDNARNLEWAMESLCWVSTPEEWSGFLAMTLSGADSSRRQVIMSILTSQPFCGNIPAANMQSLCPLLLAYLMENRTDTHTSNARMQIRTGALTIIGDQHYWPALAFLSAQFADYNEPTITMEIALISKMGKRGLSLLSTCLENSGANRRLNAVELIGMAYRTHRYGREQKPVDDYEYSLMVKLYSEQIESRLQTLAQKDASGNIQQMAEKTIREIQTEIQTWKSHARNMGI